MSRKVYLVTDDDFNMLTTMIDRDPLHGQMGGSSDVLNNIEQMAHNKAHRFINYQVRTWISKIKE